MGSDDGGAAVKKMGFLEKVKNDGAEVGCVNVCGWECETETDGEGHPNERSGHWKAFCHVSGANGIVEGNDIADAATE
jgi:hypothetical protein